MKLRAFLLALVMFALVACSSGVKIDGSSEDAFRESLAEMVKQLPEDERGEFAGQVMGAIMLQAMSLAFSPDANEDDVNAQLYGLFDGMTYEEVQDQIKSMSSPE